MRGLRRYLFPRVDHAGSLPARRIGLELDVFLAIADAAGRGRRRCGKCHARHAADDRARYVHGRSRRIIGGRLSLGIWQAYAARRGGALYGQRLDGHSVHYYRPVRLYFVRRAGAPFFRLRRSDCARHPDVSGRDAHDGRHARHGAERVARSDALHRRAALDGDADDSVPRRENRPVDGRIALGCPRERRNCAVAVHRAEQPVPVEIAERAARQPDRDDFSIRHVALS